MQRLFLMEGNIMRRSNGEGTIYKRKDGRWCAAFYDDAPCPKRHFVYGNTQAEVKRKLKEKKVSPDTSDFTVMGNKTSFTLEEWILYFLDNYKKNEVKETTLSSYFAIYRKHIKGTILGRTKLKRITVNQLQCFYNDKSAEGYNAKTVKHIHIQVNSALNKAVQIRLIPENVNKYVVLPKRESFEARILSKEEVSRILNEAREEKLYPIIVLIIYTGLRKGEAMALKWEDIDFEERELRVKGSLCRVDIGTGEDGNVIHTYKVLSPKTVKSRRTIPLTDVAIDALRLQQERQMKMKEYYKDIYNDEDFVFARYDGRYLNQRGFMDEYHAFLKKYNIPDIRFHDLRHTFASLLLEAGESLKVIQELLGHSSINTTMDIYTHITKQGKANAVNKLDDLFKQGA